MEDIGEQSRLAEMLKSDDVSIGAIAQEISNWPELTVRVLQVVNSPEMGVRQRVERIDHAIAMIGRDRIANIVQQIARTDAPHATKGPHSSSVGRSESRPADVVEKSKN